jgi:hypothetical protein
LRHNNREVAHRAKKLDGKPPAPAPIRTRARYAEYCARKGALSKANPAMTSDLTPSAAPTNMNELRAKNSEPTHPDRDPTNFMKRLFSSSTSARITGLDRWCPRRTSTGGVSRELMASLFMGDDEDLQGLISTHMIL